MAAAQKIVIGTRGSRLALAQAGLVADALRRQTPGVTVEMKVITTKGDVDQSPVPLDVVGKTWFTAEIEEALLRGEVDVAAHSLKDMTPEKTPGLATVVVLARANPADVLISKSGALLKDLPQGVIIGTDSMRRKILILERRPDIIVESIRGNVDTRIRKLREENYEAIVLAAAGLERIGMTHEVTEFFDPAAFLPAPGQGILAAQVREGELGLLSSLNAIQDMPTRIAADAERAFSEAVGGGCKLPVGCYAQIDAGTIRLYGMIGDDESHVIRRSMASGSAGQAVDVAKELAKNLLS